MDVDGELTGMDRAARKVESEPKAYSSESQEVLRNQRSALQPGSEPPLRERPMAPSLLWLRAPHGSDLP